MIRNSSHVVGLKIADAAAKVLGVKVQGIDVRTGADLDRAFAAALRQRTDAFVVFPLRIASPDYHKVLDFAVKNRLPTLPGTRERVEAGGLMSYGPNFPDQVRRAGIYIDKILKGEQGAGVLDRRERAAARDPGAVGWRR